MTAIFIPKKPVQQIKLKNRNWSKFHIKKVI